MFTDFRLKVLRFFRKNSKILIIAFCAWVVIFLINLFLKNYEPYEPPKTTYEPHTSVMESYSVPENVSNSVEDMIDEYMEYCNNSEWPKAYDMLSDTCKEYAFDNDISNYMEYMYKKMPKEKKYSIQNYSNDGNTYIYQVKYADDYLATGLTNSTYTFTEEKIIFKKKKNGTIDMAVGNFLDYEDIKNISENEYLKVDVKSVVKYYSLEDYTVKLTNRSDYIIVISDFAEQNEVSLNLNSGDVRNRTDVENDIVLQPRESKTLSLRFHKFYDNDDNAKSLTFGSIRVMENYSGTKDIDYSVIQSEIQNSISKFSVTIPITYKK